MDHILGESKIKLTFLQDRRALAAIQWPRILDDLSDAGAPPNRLLWCDLDGLTHVVLAQDPETEEFVGVLGITERTTTREPYLTIEAAMLRPGSGSATLLRAMVAHVLARIISMDGRPAALAVPRADRSTEPVLRDLDQTTTATVLHPPARGNIIALRTAELARRIGTASMILDLRAASEVPLLRDLKRLHRSRKETIPHIMKTPARIGDATHHPRTAIRTGRNG